MRTLMKVLKNLFGNNTKISASDIAIKDSNSKAKALSEYLNAGFASMHTSFSYKAFTSEQVVTGWEKIISCGDITAQPNNDRIVIKNTKLLEISGNTAGCLNASVHYLLKESNGGDSLLGNEGWFLFQGSGIGNNYWSLPLRTCIVELEPDKVYYLQLLANGYRNDNFEMNNGFGKYATFIQAKKLE